MFTKKTNLLHVAIAVILVMAVWFMPFNPLSEIVTVGAESESAPVVGSGTDEIVQIPDQNLKNWFLEYDLNSDYELSVSEMENVIDITILPSIIDNKIDFITSLEGIQYAVNVEKLSIYDCKASDYSFITNMTNLSELNIARSQIADLSFISDFSKLKKLSLTDCGINDISKLSSLSSLTFLDLSDNKIESFEPLSEMVYLELLNLTNNQVQTIPDMSQMTSLEILNLSSNNVSDITNLNTAPKTIWDLKLSNNDISDISVLSRFNHIIRLYLNDNNISDITALTGMTTIKNLSLGNNNISNFSVIEAMSGIEMLNLSENNISNLPDLSLMVSLQDLDLSLNNLSSVPNLSSVDSLIGINMSFNQISKISSWVNSSNLQYLDLTGNQLTQIPEQLNVAKLYLGSNQIADISNLDNFINANPNVHHFDLSNNPISDIDVINDFPRIVASLNLSNCNISDISNINNPKVRTLDLSNNAISEISFLSNISSIIDLNLSGNKIVSTSIVDNIVWNSLNALNLSNNLLTDVDFFANFTSPHTVGFIDFSNNRISNISPLAEASSKLSIFSLNFSNNKLTDIAPIDDFYKNKVYTIYGLNVSENYLDVSEGSANLNIIKGWQERGIEAIYSDQKTIAVPTPSPTPVPDKKPDPTPTPVPPQKPAATPTPAPLVPEQPKSESGATIITNPYNKTEKEYTKPVTQVAVTEEELLVDHHDSIPAVVAKMDKTVYSEPVKLAVKPVDISTEEGKAKLAAVEKEVDRILSLVKEQSSTAVTEEAKIEKVVLLDLSLMTVNGSQSVQPTSGKVTITIPLPDGFDPAKTVIAHAKSNGTVELLKTTIADGWITFETNSFSPFSIMQLSVPAAEVLAAVEAESDIKIDADQMQKTGENGNNSWMFLPLSLIISGALVIRRKLVLAENETAE